MNAPKEVLAIASDISEHAAQHPAFADLSQWHDDLTRIRRELHQHPELGYEEHDTAKLIVAELEKYGVDEIHTEIGVTGVVAVIHGRQPASGTHKTIGLRADIDALPMTEENDFSHKSKNPGKMHGCGHDGHTTMLLGAARYLAASRNFAGTAHLIFQPGEEGHAGARAMINDGLFKRFPCDAVFAMHNWPGLDAGKIAMQAGPVMAAADRLTIKVIGKGGHGAHPYLTVDPVVVSAHIITALQSIVSRNVSPIDSAVISLCAMQAGDLEAMSVIPPYATLVGTVRTFRHSTQDTVQARVEELTTSIAHGFGATAEINYERIYPSTINSNAEAAFAAEVAAELAGPENLVPDLDPSMGSEDFSFMLNECPGAYFRIGQAGEPGGCFLHNTKYDFNDGILPLGGALYARLVERWLPVSEQP